MSQTAHRTARVAALALATGIAFGASTTPAQAAPNGDPIGFLDGVSYGERGLHAFGWAADQDAPQAPLTIHIYIEDKTFVAALGPADKFRPDVDAAYPGIGQNHGFDQDGIPFTYRGPQEICAYAINAENTPGGNSFLGCKTLIFRV